MKSNVSRNGEVSFETPKRISLLENGTMLSTLIAVTCIIGAVIIGTFTAATASLCATAILFIILGMGTYKDAVDGAESKEEKAQISNQILPPVLVVSGIGLVIVCSMLITMIL